MTDFAAPVVVDERPPYRDRSGALVFFGIVQICLGLLCVLLVLGIAASVELASRRAGAPETPRSSYASALIIYSLAAAYFIAVGVGSIRARRWARALSVAVSALWLAVGILGTIFMAVIMPRALVSVRPSEAPAVMGCIFAVLAVALILVPLGLFAFYRSPHVAATVNARDPRVRWTDRAPLPILAVSVMLAGSAVAMLGNVGSPAVPFFGTILTGATATLTVLALAGLFGFLAVQLFRLKRSAWWTLVLLQIIGGIAAAISFANTDLVAAYKQMGVDTQQLEAMRINELFHSPGFWTACGVTWLAYLAFLVWLRRYFNTAGPLTRAGDTVAASAGSP